MKLEEPVNGISTWVCILHDSFVDKKRRWRAKHRLFSGKNRKFQFQLSYGGHLSIKIASQKNSKI